MSTDDTKETRILPVDLTATELRERALEAAEVNAKIRRSQDEQKTTAARLKNEQKELEARWDLLSRVQREGREGREGRETECRWVRNDTYSRMELHRLDTGEVIESRPLTAAEKQLLMFPGPVEAKKKASGGDDGGEKN